MRGYAADGGEYPGGTRVRAVAEQASTTPPPHRALRPPTHAQPGLGTVAWAATAEASGGTRGSRLLSGLGLGLRGALADGVRPSRAAAGS